MSTVALNCQHTKNSSKCTKSNTALALIGQRLLRSFSTAATLAHKNKDLNFVIKIDNNIP